jgi:hypothetical protein
MQDSLRGDSALRTLTGTEFSKQRVTPNCFDDFRVCARTLSRDARSKRGVLGAAYES